MRMLKHSVGFCTEEQGGVLGSKPYTAGLCVAQIADYIGNTAYGVQLHANRHDWSGLHTASTPSSVILSQHTTKACNQSST